MVVKIDVSLFSKPDLFTKIDRFFYFFFERRYDFYLDDENILDSEWIQNARFENRDILMEAFERTIQNSITNDLTIFNINDPENNIYTIDEALFILEKPVYIFLENAVNDQNFILGLLTNFKKRGQKSLRFIRSEWLVFQNGGGKNDIINQIENKLTSFNQKSLDNKYYLRAIVIVDSDKNNPTDVNESNNLLEVFCNQNDISLHILEKREIENYMPIQMLYEINDINNNKVETLENLNPTQQDYYDLDSGFNRKSKNGIDDIFSSLTNEEYNTLKNGFSEEIKTKSEVPKLFLNSKLTRDLLTEKCSHQQDSNELLNIIDKINRLL
jgi:hypothetical protein